MKIPYVLLDFSGEVESTDSQWDMTLLTDILEGRTWQPAKGYEFLEYHKSLNKDGRLLIIPARQNAIYLTEIQSYIYNLEWVMLILVGDEERLFDYKQLHHPKMKIWLMQPKPDDEADYYLGSGYTSFTLGYDSDSDKSLDWFFAGQNNHQRRQNAINVLERMLGREDMTGVLEPSAGFTQGLPVPAYYQQLTRAKSAPAPSGIASPDSFRVYEALEAGAVPIADDISALWSKPGYWRKVFNGSDIPFKIYADADNIEGYIADVVRDYPAGNNKVFAWWQGVKRDMAYQLSQQVHELSGIAYPADQNRNKITVLILTSPIPSNPSTEIIEQTIVDIRAVLPDCEIIIGIDGVRPEQEERRADYEEYTKRLLHLQWAHILPVVFEKHMHQAAMTRELLKLVNTPALLFVEHDAPLCPDFEYDWQNLVKVIESGNANVIRFHHEGAIPTEHDHLILGEREIIDTVPLLKTSQWSQRPHLASTVFYRDMVDRYFTENSRIFIEDVIHGAVQSDVDSDWLMGWYKWRLWIFYPEGNIKRSYTTDGRKGDSKFEEKFVK